MTGISSDGGVSAGEAQLQQMQQQAEAMEIQDSINTTQQQANASHVQELSQAAQAWAKNA